MLMIRRWYASECVQCRVRRRERAVRKLYRWLAFSLLGFFFLYLVSALHGPAAAQHASTIARETARRALSAVDHGSSDRGSLGSGFNRSLLGGWGDGGDAGLTAAQRSTRAALFLSVSLINLLAVSTMWARAADVFSSDAGEAIDRAGACEPVLCCPRPAGTAASCHEFRMFAASMPRLSSAEGHSAP